VSEGPVISIVEDNESVRTATASLVRSYGYAVHSFASAVEFLQSPYAQSTICVVSDVQMPGIDGLELQRQMKDGGYRASMIFITAFPDKQTETQALKAGAVCFLHKPVDAGALMKCLGEAIKRTDESETID
jgi:FixJ family two-component response regulator